MTQVLEITRRDKIRQTLGLINVTELDVCYDVTSEKIQLDCYSFLYICIILNAAECYAIFLVHIKPVSTVSLSLMQVQFRTQFNRYNIFTGMYVYFFNLEGI